VRSCTTPAKTGIELVVRVGAYLLSGPSGVRTAYWDWVCSPCSLQDDSQLLNIVVGQAVVYGSIDDSTEVF